MHSVNPSGTKSRPNSKRSSNPDRARHRTPNRLGRAIVAGALLFPLVGTALAANAPTAHATPGVPQPPRTILSEDFESYPDTGPRGLITTFKGGSLAGDSYYSDPVYCNGFIVSSFSTIGTGDCTGGGNASGNYITATDGAKSLGGLNGKGESNIAAAFITNGSKPTDAATVIQTHDLTDMASGTGFFRFSANVYAANCWASKAPKLRALLTDGATEQALGTANLSPCDPTDGSVRLSWDSGDYATFDADQVGLVIREYSGTSYGNDFVLDDLLLLDGTPALDVTIVTPRVVAGGITRLILTVTNTSELAAKSGFAFTNNLPAGLMVADTPDLSSTCGGTTDISDPTQIVLTGGALDKGKTTCRVELDITSAGPLGAGEETAYTNGPRAFSDLVGLTRPSSADVVFYSPNLIRGSVTMSPSPVVGQEVTADPGTWGPDPVELAYQWLLDGVPIPGANGASYTPVPADAGGSLTVQVTGTKPGYTTATATATAQVVALGTLSGGPATLSGGDRVSDVLTADPGVWQPSSATFSYQWLRDGVPIPGAAGQQYQTTNVDAGTRISVRVTVSAPGYTAVTEETDFILVKAAEPGPGPDDGDLANTGANLAAALTLAAFVTGAGVLARRVTVRRR